MGLVIGMDEAGYGPNLGPLVVTATAWEVPGNPQDTDFWSAFADVAGQSRPTNPSRLHIADSKEVYSPSRGIANLETSVLSVLPLLGRVPNTFQELWQMLTDGCQPSDGDQPWFQDQKLPLPQKIERGAQLEPGRRLQQSCEREHIRLRAVQSDIVLTPRFNRLVRECDSKGVALSRISMNLLKRVWDPNDPQPTLIVADKHGGRNRYDGLLDEVLDGRMIFRLQEGRERSCYRVGSTDIRFQMKAEAYFPVAVASLFCKYVRELSMTLFNRYWAEHVPGVKPTKGYPLDARRFKNDIAEAQERLEIGDDILWRAR